MKKILLQYELVITLFILGRGTKPTKQNYVYFFKEKLCWQKVTMKKKVEFTEEHVLIAFDNI